MQLRKLTFQIPFPSHMLCNCSRLNHSHQYDGRQQGLTVDIYIWKWLWNIYLVQIFLLLIPDLHKF